VRVLAVLPADGIALVLGERRITGHGPDGQRVDLTGSGATVVRRQPGGWWCIAADAWRLDGAGRFPPVPPSP
jgi:ketosteroid isomerase-like protein